MADDRIESSHPLVRFYDGSGTDRDGRTLEDILGLHHFAMESDHRFVQWLFPTPEKSAFGYFTPRLSPEGAREFRERGRCSGTRRGSWSARRGTRSR